MLPSIRRNGKQNSPESRNDPGGSLRSTRRVHGADARDRLLSQIRWGVCLTNVETIATPAYSHVKVVEQITDYEFTASIRGNLQQLNCGSIKRIENFKGRDTH